MRDAELNLPGAYGKVVSCVCMCCGDSLLLRKVKGDGKRRSRVSIEFQNQNQKIERPPKEESMSKENSTNDSDSTSDETTSQTEQPEENASNSTYETTSQMEQPTHDTATSSKTSADTETEPHDEL